MMIIITAIIACFIGFIACAVLTMTKVTDLEATLGEYHCAMTDHCKNQCEGDIRDACYSCQIYMKLNYNTLPEAKEKKTTPLCKQEMHKNSKWPCPEICGEMCVLHDTSECFYIAKEQEDV